MYNHVHWNTHLSKSIYLNLITCICIYIPGPSTGPGKVPFFEKGAFPGSCTRILVQ